MSQVIEHPKRAFLIQALGMGLFATSAGFVSPVFALGSVPAKLPPGRSIYKLKGSVEVDGVLADINTQISASSFIKTGSSSRIIFVVGTDAFILRSNSELQMSGDGLLIQGLRILSGKLLSVFGKRAKPHRIQTQTVTIGIRGTGIYVESKTEKSYVCTCYGETLITSNDDPNSSVKVKTTHHDEPFYILAGKNVKKGRIIRPAPVINHTDSELELIEQLVGRTTPFVFSSDREGGGY